MLAERRTIEEKEKNLKEAEKEAVNDIDAANELLSDGTTKLANSISSSAVDQHGVKVASLMIETAKVNLEKAKTKLASVRAKQRILSVKNKQLFERTLPGLPSKKRNAPTQSKISRKKKKTH